jgi:hypothetical protein
MGRRGHGIIRYYLGICMKGLRETTKNLSQDSRSPGRDLNPKPPEYESGMLTTRPLRCFIWTILYCLIAVVLIMTPCGLPGDYQRFVGSSCLHIQSRNADKCSRWHDYFKKILSILSQKNDACYMSAHTNSRTCVCEGRNAPKYSKTFWVAAPCSLVEVYRRFRGANSSPWW